MFNLAARTNALWLPLKDTPTGIAWDTNSATLIVTCHAESDRVLVLNPVTGQAIHSWSSGIGACSPLIQPTGDAVFCCNRFERSIPLTDLTNGRGLATGRALREPVAASLSPDQKVLAVANLLPMGPADRAVVRAAVSVLDAHTLKRLREVELPDGST